MFGRYLISVMNPNMSAGRYVGLGRRSLHAFSRQIIKPSSTPNPNRLRRYNLSPMDQTIFRNYVPFVFFYPTSPEKVSEKSRRLKISLAETLAAYYPFAGRLMHSESSVDCNDEGVEYQESQIKCTLSDAVKKYKQDLDLGLVFPPNSVWNKFDNDSSPMIVRVNYFECGGIAIAICMSHIIGDATTMSNFMNYWAAVTRRSGDHVPPHFISSPVYNDNFEECMYTGQDYSIPCTRFVFMNSELTKLKAKLRSSDGQTPTRFEFLSTLFYKSLMSVEKSRSGTFRPSTLDRPINMRSKLVPSLPKTMVGNWIWRSILKTRTDGESSWSGLLDETKMAKKKLEGMKDLDVNKLKSIYSEVLEEKYKMYFCSCMCNMDWYKVNFGWGNPVQIALEDPHVGDGYAFFDTPCGEGIEALLSFDAPELFKLELNKQIDALSSSN